MTEHDVLADDASRSRGVVSEDDGRREVKHDRGRRQCRGPRANEEPSPGVGLDVGGIDHRESACRQPPIELPMKRRERRACHPLVGLVAGDRRPIGIGRQDVIGCEMALRERRLAGTGRADEDDEAWILDDDDGHGAMMPQIRGGA